MKKTKTATRKRARYEQKVQTAPRGFAKVARGFGGQLDEVTGAWTFRFMTASEFRKVG